MCDETTETENAAYLAKRRLSRRDATMGAGATLASVLSGCAGSPPPTRQPQSGPAPAAPPPPAPTKAATTPAPESPAAPAQAATTNASMVSIDMPDGSAEAFFVTPKSGPHPGVLLWPDVAGLRDAYHSMATRLAAEGYAVLAVNQYYRSTTLPVLSSFAEWRTEAGKRKIQPMRDALSAEAVARDGAAFVQWLMQQPEVDKSKKLATIGYCMGGPFTFRTAAALPERVGVLASFHGGGLVTDQPTSPHLLFPKLQAAALICIAANDDARQPEAKTTLRQAADAAKVPAEIEVYPAQHGWCVPDSPVYDEVQAERAWSRMLATFGQHL